MGAVGSAMLALAADLTHEGNRTKAMAIIGVSIGLAFGVALVSGSILNGWIGVPGMFWLTAGLGGICLLLLYVAVPSPVTRQAHVDAEPVAAMLAKVLRDARLWRLDFGILAQHAILTATFLGMPPLLQAAGVGVGRQWLVYVPVLGVSALVLAPMVWLADRRGHMHGMLMLSIAAMGAAQLVFMRFHASLLGLVAALSTFFVAFNFLEAALPSLISKLALPKARGTALGVYSSSQFLGLFLGGAVGGWCQGRFGPLAGFAFSLCLAVLWMAATWSSPMANPEVRQP